MQKCNYKGVSGWFIPDDEKEQLDRVVLPILQAENDEELVQ